MYNKWIGWLRVTVQVTPHRAMTSELKKFVSVQNLCICCIAKNGRINCSMVYTFLRYFSCLLTKKAKLCFPPWPLQNFSIKSDSFFSKLEICAITYIITKLISVPNSCKSCFGGTPSQHAMTSNGLYILGGFVYIPTGAPS